MFIWYNFLRKLISEYKNRVIPTKALVMLSDGQKKKELFPYIKIECARFKGTTSEIFIDQKTFDGSLIEQVEMAYEFVLRHINKSAVVEGVYTKEKKVTEGKSSEKSSEKKRIKTKDKVVNIIKENPEISANEISVKIGVSQRAIEKHITNLKKEGILQRIGPDKGGYWEIVLNNA